MFRFENQEGLTLIELLITISVLAVVSAIALPVINNVVTSSNSNALTQTMKDAQDFIAKYSKSGVVLYDGLNTLSGYVDADGDNMIDYNEKIDTLTLDEKYAIFATGSAAVGSQYTNGGVTQVMITASGASGSGATPNPTPSPTYSANTQPISQTFEVKPNYNGGAEGWYVRTLDLTTLKFWVGDSVTIQSSLVNGIDISGTYSIANIQTDGSVYWLHLDPSFRAKFGTLGGESVPDWASVTTTLTFNKN